jgi:hypothetical protein
MVHETRTIGVSVERESGLYYICDAASTIAHSLALVKVDAFPRPRGVHFPSLDSSRSIRALIQSYLL